MACQGLLAAGGDHDVEGIDLTLLSDRFVTGDMAPEPLLAFGGRVLQDIAGSQLTLCRLRQQLTREGRRLGKAAGERQHARYSRAGEQIADRRAADGSGSGGDDRSGTLFHAGRR